MFCSGLAGFTTCVHQDRVMYVLLPWQMMQHLDDRTGENSLYLCLIHTKFYMDTNGKNISLKTLSRANLGISACKINAVTFQYHWLIGNIEGEEMKWVAGLVLSPWINRKIEKRTAAGSLGGTTLLLLPFWQSCIQSWLNAAYCVCRRLDKTRIIGSLTVSEWRTGCCDKQLLLSLQLLFEEWIWSHILLQYLHKNLQRNLYRKPFPVRPDNRYRSVLETDPQSGIWLSG